MNNLRSHIATSLVFLILFAAIITNVSAAPPNRDTAPPTITGVTPTGSNVPVSAQITLTFSEAMNQTSAESAFSTSPHTTGSFSWTSSKKTKTYTMTYTPGSNLAYSTTYTVTVGTGAKDTAGNNLASPYSWQFSTPDTISPGVVLSSLTVNPVNGLIAVTAEFSENVTGFEAIDIVVTNGTVENFIAVDGNTYTFDVNPEDGPSVAVTINVPAGAAQDAAANSNTASNTLSYASDTVAPETTIDGNPPTLSNGSSATFAFSSNEAGSSFQCRLDTGAFETCFSSKSYSSLSDGSHTFEVKATDTARNTDTTPANYTWTVDTAPPAITENAPTGSNVPVNTQITVTFSEAMNQISAQSAFSTFPATQGSFSWSGNNMTYTPSPNLNYSMQYTVSVGTGAQDLAGNNMSSYWWQFNTTQQPDTTPPIVSSIVRAGANPTNAASVDFTVTFSESVTGVDTTDFTLTTTGVSGASVSSVSGSGSSYTVTVNTGTGDGTIRLDVIDNDSIQDAANNRLGGGGADNGNFNTGEAYNIDKTPPSSVTALNNVTFEPNYINWTWTNPDDIDFSRVVVYLNGIYQKDIPKGMQFYNAADLTHDTEYIIGTRTVDTSGNINLTWANATARTAVSGEFRCNPSCGISIYYIISP